jgi:hypothetical protein
MVFAAAAWENERFLRLREGNYSKYADFLG